MFRKPLSSRRTTVNMGRSANPYMQKGFEYRRRHAAALHRRNFVPQPPALVTAIAPVIAIADPPPALPEFEIAPGGYDSHYETDSQESAGSIVANSPLPLLAPVPIPILPPPPAAWAGAVLAPNSPITPLSRDDDDED